MMSLASLGRMLIFAGILLLFLGSFLLAASRVPGLGRLPGDILIKRGPMTFYFPLATSLLVSLLLSLVFWIIGRFR